MIRRFIHGVAVFACFALIVSAGSRVTLAQTTNGSIVVETMDPTKALLPGTHLVLTDIETGVTR